MIAFDNLRQRLEQLGFTQTAQRHSKTIGHASLTADLKKGEIVYPGAQGLKIHLRTNSNLSVLENFVVLECVRRLLEKGYQPANIELEPQFKLGHGMSGGRANNPAYQIDNEKYTLDDLNTVTASDQQKQFHAIAAKAMITTAPARKQAILGPHP